MSILEVKGLKKTYTTRFGGNQVQALKMCPLVWKRANMWPSWVNPVPVRQHC